MSHDFDTIIDRCDTDSIKWQHYGPDVLPLWVADMDFAAPEPVLRALQERIAHGVLGYPCDPADLRAVVVERLERLYSWRVAPEALLFVPGVVTGFNWALARLALPGQGLLLQTPVYPPILHAPQVHGLLPQENELAAGPDGYYHIDLDAFEAAITAETAAFLLCNPHNPVGRVFTRAELEAMAEICLRHNLYVVSDEIHCDLLFPGQRHVPMATLDPEVARRTVTLIAPSKTYNIAGLHSSVAIVEDPELRALLDTHREEMIGYVNVLGLTAALAAYRDGDEWLEELLAYLTANRDFVVQQVRETLPGITVGAPEATYLAWLDCRDLGLPGSPSRFFLKEARVALNDGQTFGGGGEGFARLNFGCPRGILEEALGRMQAALERRT